MATAKRTSVRRTRASARGKSVSSNRKLKKAAPHPRPLPTTRYARGGRGAGSATPNEPPKRPKASAKLPLAKPKGGPIPGTPSPLRTRLTPELHAHARRLYEETDQFVTAIALDCGVDESVIRRMGVREGWVRYVAPPRDLPPVAKLLAEVEALEAMPPVTLEQRIADIDHLHRTTMSQLAEVEALRARTTPSAKDAERNAHTLSSLTETMRKLQGMRCATPISGSTHDTYASDMPADPDEFRDELARRIRAFVASRAGTRDADGDSGPAVVDEVR